MVQVKRNLGFFLRGVNPFYEVLTVFLKLYFYLNYNYLKIFKFIILIKL